MSYCRRGLCDMCLGSEGPWQGDVLWTEVTCGEFLPEPLEVRLPYSMLPLQGLPEALVKIRLEEM